MSPSPGHPTDDILSFGIGKHGAGRPRPLDSDAGEQDVGRRSAPSRPPGQSGRCSRPTANGWRTRRERRRSLGCQPRRLPAALSRDRRDLSGAEADRGLPSGMGEIRRGELVLHRCGNCGTDGGSASHHGRWRATFGTPVRFPASVSGDRVATEPRAWDILPDGRFIGITSSNGGRRARFFARDAPRPELVGGAEAAGSGAVADGYGNRHPPRPLRDPRPARRRRDGRGLSRARHDAGPRRRAEDRCRRRLPATPSGWRVSSARRRRSRRSTIPTSRRSTASSARRRYLCARDGAGRG